MKHFGKFAFIMIFAACFFAQKSAIAQDPLKVAPKAFIEKLNNAHVHVLEYASMPGQKETMHSHPAILIYVIKGGKMKSTTPDGKSQIIEYKDGDLAWREPITHTIENVGTTEIKALLIETKK
jgi:quercetin dioxygenase-like cupin family protein